MVSMFGERLFCDWLGAQVLFMCFVGSFFIFHGTRKPHEQNSDIQPVVCVALGKRITSIRLLDLEGADAVLS